jgi:hypothetical protein
MLPQSIPLLPLPSTSPDSLGEGSSRPGTDSSAHAVGFSPSVHRWGGGRLHVGRVPGLRAQGAQEGAPHGARAHLQLIGLEEGAALTGPVRLRVAIISGRSWSKVLEGLSLAQTQT